MSNFYFYQVTKGEETRQNLGLGNARAKERCGKASQDNMLETTNLNFGDTLAFRILSMKIL